MAYAHKVVRVTAMGTSFNGAELWTTGFYVGVLDADASAPTQEYADVVKAAWQTFYSDYDTGIKASWKCEGIKCARLGTDGKTELDSVVTSYYGTPIGGGGAGVDYPPQISVVASLIADSGKNLGGKGRMYLPGVGHALGTDGRFTQGNALGLATNLKEFFDSITGSFETIGSVINASQGRAGIGGTAPVNRYVTSIKVGNVYDTQRRRRNGLVEQYSTVTLGTTP